MSFYFASASPNKTVACNPDFIAVINSDRQVVCWRKKQPKKSKQYIDQPHIENAVSICCGSKHVAVLTADGRVVCWGETWHGQCNVPPDLEHVVAICCEENTTIALTSDGRVICWGDNGRKQCEVPADLENVVSIWCGHSHAAAITAEGRVVCWGCNDCGQCNVPPDLVDVTRVYCGWNITSAITHGNVVCWGEAFGESIVYTDFIHEKMRESTHKQLFCNGNIADVIANVMLETIALTTDGTLIMCKPSGYRGLLEIGKIVSISHGFEHVAVITETGKLHCCGKNCSKQCNVPPDLDSVIQVHCGKNYTLAITADGKVHFIGNVKGLRDVPADLVAYTEMVVLI